MAEEMTVEEYRALPEVKKKTKRKDFEHQAQKALVQWSRLQPPPICWLYAIPNGGRRSKAVAGRMKAEGVLKGIPDLQLPVARGGYHALYIEMKSPTGRLSPEQKEMIKNLRYGGFCVEVARSFEEGKKIIETYMSTGQHDTSATPNTGFQCG